MINLTREKKLVLAEATLRAPPALQLRIAAVTGDQAVLAKYLAGVKRDTTAILHALVMMDAWDLLPSVMKNRQVTPRMAGQLFCEALRPKDGKWGVHPKAIELLAPLTTWSDILLRISSLKEFEFVWTLIPQDQRSADLALKRLASLSDLDLTFLRRYVPKEADHGAFLRNYFFGSASFLHELLKDIGMLGYATLHKHNMQFQLERLMLVDRTFWFESYMAWLRDSNELSLMDLYDLPTRTGGKIVVPKRLLSMQVWQDWLATVDIDQDRLVYQ